MDEELNFEEERGTGSMGVHCFGCGDLMPVSWRVMGHAYCPNCFTGYDGEGDDE